MELQLNDKEIETFQRLADSHDGTVLHDFFKKVIAEVTNIRNITDKSESSLKARELLADILELNFINRLERMSGRVEDITNEFN